MLIINKILETGKVIKYLESRNLIKQYKKSKDYILNGNFEIVDFKYRKPKNEGVLYFRINKQFRAFGFLDGNVLKIFKIDNHQN